MRFFIKVQNLALFLAILFVTIIIIKFLNEESDPIDLHHKRCSKQKLNREWIVNHKIAQYSSYVIKFPDHFRIESLIVLNDYKLENNEINEGIKCVIKIGNYNNEIYVSKIKHVVHTTTQGLSDVKYHTKIVCDIIHNHPKMNAHFNIAVVDTSHFKTFDDVVFQSPTFIDGTQEKNKEVAHCVHMAHGLQHSNFGTWLLLQNKLGINNIKIYTIDNSLIQHKYSNNVEVIKYDLSYDGFCGCLEVDQTECKKIYKMFFGENLFNYREMWQHEKLQTNDCYLSLKYAYEYVTNYETDEIIMPRNENSLTKDFDKREEKINCSSINKMSLYDYSVKLFEAQSKYKVASMAFEYVYFVKFNSKLDDFFNSINKTLQNTLNKVESESSYVTLTVDETANEGQRKHIKFFHKPKHEDHMKRILKAYESIKYLVKTPIHDTFDRLMYIRVDGSVGRSIFNTNYTETISQHHAMTIKSGNVKLLPIDIENGFVGHYKDEPFSYFQTAVFEITSFDFDIDYYLFFLASYRSSLCSV
jgi:hypothetical protein